MVILIVYGVRSLFHRTASVAQLHSTSSAQAETFTTGYLNKAVLLPPFIDL